MSESETEWIIDRNRLAAISEQAEKIIPTLTQKMIIQRLIHHLLKTDLSQLSADQRIEMQKNLNEAKEILQDLQK